MKKNPTATPTCSVPLNYNYAVSTGATIVADLTANPAVLASGVLVAVGVLLLIVGVTGSAG